MIILPVPDASSSRSAFDTVVLIVLSIILILSSIFKLDKTTCPVPLGAKFMFPFVDTAVISLPDNLMFESTAVSKYSSYKFSFIFCPAILKVSPVPSFATIPMLIVSLAILDTR